MFWLRIRMWLLVAALFAIVYAVVAMIAASLGIGNFYFYLLLSLVMMFIQYMLGPKLVEWTMRVKYVKKEEYPRLFQIVEELSSRAGIPVPKIEIGRAHV